MDNWVGYVIAGFAIVFIANVYMTLYAFIKQGVKKERIQATLEEQELNEMQQDDKGKNTYLKLR